MYVTLFPHSGLNIENFRKKFQSNGDVTHRGGCHEDAATDRW